MRPYRETFPNTADKLLINEVFCFGIENNISTTACVQLDDILFEELPARIEPELEIQGKSGQWHKLHPDFMFLCFDGTILLVEHFGRWDDERYAERNKRKIQEYLDCGFVLGDNLIVTSDNAEHCTNEKMIVMAIDMIKKRMFG